MFSPKAMGRDTVAGFEAHDRLSLFGTERDAESALGRTMVKGANAVIDLGQGDVLTLKGFTDLESGHFAIA